VYRGLVGKPEGKRPLGRPRRRWEDNTGWGKITSLNFKVNSKKTIRDTKILFLDCETTTWEVLNHIVLKRISCVY
jgi:hypothetical protein